MRYLTLGEVVELHRRVVERTGGAGGIRDLSALESALAQPRMAFSGSDLYPSLVEKAVALCVSIVGNHPFVDGNKRVAHAAMETFLMLNGLAPHRAAVSKVRQPGAAAGHQCSKDPSKSLVAAGLCACSSGF